MNRLWRSVKFTVGWTITATDETAIAGLPDTAWTDSLHQDDTATDSAQAAELPASTSGPATGSAGYG